MLNYFIQVIRNYTPGKRHSINILIMLNLEIILNFVLIEIGAILFMVMCLGAYALLFKTSLIYSL